MLESKRSNTGVLGVSHYNHRYYAEVVIDYRRVRKGFSKLSEAIAEREYYENLRDDLSIYPKEEIGRKLDERGIEWQRH